MTRDEVRLQARAIDFLEAHGREHRQIEPRVSKGRFFPIEQESALAGKRHVFCVRIAVDQRARFRHRFERSFESPDEQVAKCRELRAPLEQAVALNRPGRVVARFDLLTNGQLRVVGEAVE